MFDGDHCEIFGTLRKIKDNFGACGSYYRGKTDNIRKYSVIKEEVNMAKKVCPETSNKINFPDDCADCEYLKPRGKIKCCVSPKKKK